MRNLLLFPLFALAPLHVETSEITRIWLTHKSDDPSKLVVNWMSDEPGDSVVRFGLTPEYGETVRTSVSPQLPSERLEEQFSRTERILNH